MENNYTVVVKVCPQSTNKLLIKIPFCGKNYEKVIIPLFSLLKILLIIMFITIFIPQTIVNNSVNQKKLSTIEKVNLFYFKSSFHFCVLLLYFVDNLKKYSKAIHK